jgi:hypothetical protein
MGWPHEPQNLKFLGTDDPHLGHVNKSSGGEL